MKQQAIFIVVLILLSATWISAQSADKTVESINKRYAQIGEKARLSETDDDQGEYGELFMNTLTVNSRNHQWRAIGIYGKTYKFFYKQIENIESRLYPDQLVFVKVERTESNRKYLDEYLYSDTGAIMLYRQTSETDGETPKERKIYFSGQTPLRTIVDGNTSGRFSATESKNLMETWRDASKIKELFIKSINL